MNLTDEQHAICQAARDLDVGSSLKIQAFAGTGKTTTLAAIAESLAQRKFLYLVFNRAAADEVEHKMPSNVTVNTRSKVHQRAEVKIHQLKGTMG
jgi:F-box protein, helicase, 18